MPINDNKHDRSGIPLYSAEQENEFVQTLRGKVITDISFCDCHGLNIVIDDTYRLLVPGHYMWQKRTVQ